MEDSRKSSTEDCPSTSGDVPAGESSSKAPQGQDFQDPLLVGPFKFAGKASNIQCQGVFYTEVVIEKNYFGSNVVIKLPKTTPLSVLMEFIPLRVGSEVSVDPNKYLAGKKAKLIVFGFAVNSADIQEAFCIVMSHPDRSFYAVPIISLRTELIPNDCANAVEENWESFLKWNENFVSCKARYEEFAPPPPPPPALPSKRESSGRASFLKARQKLFEQHSPSKSPGNTKQAKKENSALVCGCESTITKQSATVLKLQGVVKEQGASIAALTTTVKELKAKVEDLVAQQLQNKSNEPVAKVESQTQKKRGQRGPGKKQAEISAQVKEEQSVQLHIPQNTPLFQTIAPTIPQTSAWPSMMTVPHLPQQLSSSVKPSCQWPFPFPMAPQMATPSATQPSAFLQIQQQPRAFFGLDEKGNLGWHAM